MARLRSRWEKLTSLNGRDNRPKGKLGLLKLHEAKKYHFAPLRDWYKGAILVGNKHPNTVLLASKPDSDLCEVGRLT